MTQYRPVQTLLFLLPGLITIVGVGIAGTGLYLFQDKLIYQPRPYQDAQLAEFAARGGVSLPFAAPHGKQVAFYVPCDGLPEAVWCCFAGNGGKALAWETFARTNAAPGRAFLLVEWPGYGASEGTPRPFTLRDSVRGAIHVLSHHLGVAPDVLRSRCGVIGHSLGCAGALIAANELEARQAVLFAPFTSLRDMAVLRRGELIAKLLSHDYDNRAELAALAGRAKARVTIFHGTEDRVIPIRMARELQSRHPQTVQLIELPGLGHGGLYAPAAPYLQTAMTPEER